MKLSHAGLLIVVLIIGYVVGAKYPSLASKIGIA